MAKTLIKATQDQFQWVMYFLGSFIMPDKLGTREYTPIERARIQERISALFDDLLPHSYYAQQHGEEYLSCFGDKDDWIPDPNKPGEKKAARPSKMYEVELGQKGASGMIWLFTVLLTPPEKIKGKNPMEKDTITNPYMVTPALAARFLWPMVKQLGKEVELRRAVGLDDSEFEPWTEVKTEVKGATK